MANLVCEYCGIEYTHRDKRRRFCSKKCYFADKVESNQRPCKNCGTLISPRGRIREFCDNSCRLAYLKRTKVYPKCLVCGGDITLYRRRYCSEECRVKAGVKVSVAGQTLNCTYCGVPIYVGGDRVLRSKNFFCCTDHANAWQGRNKVELICEHCGKPFLISKSMKHQRFCSMECRNASPEMRKKWAAATAKQQHLKITNLEIAGYALLDDLGIKHERQKVLCNKFCVDAFVPSANAVIQFDGDYWHGHPQRFPEPNAMQQKNIKRDGSQDKYLTKCGYTIIRIWESDIETDVEAVKTRLRDLVTGLPKRD